MGSGLCSQEYSHDYCMEQVILAHQAKHWMIWLVYVIAMIGLLITGVVQWFQCHVFETNPVLMEKKYCWVNFTDGLIIVIGCFIALCACLVAVIYFAYLLCFGSSPAPADLEEEALEDEQEPEEILVIQ